MVQTPVCCDFRDRLDGLKKFFNVERKSLQRCLGNYGLEYLRTSGNEKRCRARRYCKQEPRAAHYFPEIEIPEIKDRFVDRRNPSGGPFRARLFLSDASGGSGDSPAGDGDFGGLRDGPDRASICGSSAGAKRRVYPAVRGFLRRPWGNRQRRPKKRITRNYR